MSRAAIPNVAQARALDAEAAQKKARAAALRDEASELMSDVPSYAPEDLKHPAWEREDEALSLEREAVLASLEAEANLHTSLTYAPGLMEAQTALATRFHAAHQRAELSQDEEGALQAEVRISA